MDINEIKAKFTKFYFDPRYRHGNLPEEWTPQLEKLFYDIETYCVAKGLPLPTVSQIKVKYGQLRVYLDHNSFNMDPEILKMVEIAERSCDVAREGG